MEIDKVTVGIATYNRPELLKRALKHLKNQNIERLEVILSNDLPDQNCERLLKDLNLPYKYLTQAPPLGVLHNHLSTYELCDSDLFMFHGDDDFLLDDCLELLSEQLKTSLKYDSIFSDFMVGSETSFKTIGISRIPFIKFFSSQQEWKRVISFYLMPSMIGKQNIYYGLHRKSSLDKIDFESTIPKRNFFYNMDEMISFSLILNAPLLILNKPLFFFTQNNIKYYKEFSTNNRLVSFIYILFYEFIVLLDYIRVCKRLKFRFLFITLFPLKLFLLFYYKLRRDWYY